MGAKAAEANKTYWRTKKRRRRAEVQLSKKELFKELFLNFEMNALRAAGE